MMSLEDIDDEDALNVYNVLDEDGNCVVDRSALINAYKQSETAAESAKDDIESLNDDTSNDENGDSTKSLKPDLRDRNYRARMNKKKKRRSGGKGMGASQSSSVLSAKNTVKSIQSEVSLAKAKMPVPFINPKLRRPSSSTTSKNQAEKKVPKAPLPKRSVESICDELNSMLKTLISEMSSKKYCFDTMSSVTKLGLDLYGRYESFKIPMDTFITAADLLLQTTKEVDIRIRTRYLQCFRVIFLFSENFNEAVRYVYGLKFKLDNTDITLPQLNGYFDRFNEFLHTLLMTISQTPELDDDIVREFAFMLMISPRSVLRVIVMANVHLTHRYDTLKIVQVLRRIPAFCELRFGLSNSPGVSRSIITALVYHFFIAFGKNSELVNFNDPDQYNRLLAVLLLFTTTRFRNGEVALKPVFDPNDLVIDFICQQFLPNASHNPINLHFALDLFHMFLVPRYRGGDVKDVSVVRWKNTSDTSQFAVDIGVLMHHLSNISMLPKIEPAIIMKSLSLLQYLGIVVEKLSLTADEYEAYQELQARRFPPVLGSVCGSQRWRGQPAIYRGALSTTSMGDCNFQSQGASSISSQRRNIS